MADNILLIGAGPTGTATALRFALRGQPVTLVSRRGTGPQHPLVTRIAADASDARGLARLATGARTVVNCAMPPYHRWPEEFPAIGAATLAAAEAAGADLVTLGNVYGYGRVAGPMAEDLPLMPHTVKGRVRAGMWDLSRRSAVRATEVRASDYIGRGAASLFTLTVLPGLLEGQPVGFAGDLDATHSWSWIGDVADTLVAAAGCEASWGRAWHVPSRVASVRELAAMLASAAGVAEPLLTRVDAAALQAMADADPVMREVLEMAYLYDEPSVLDSRETERLLGVAAAPWETSLQDTLRGQAARS